MSGKLAVNIIAEHHAEHGEAGSQQMPGCWCGWQGEVLEHPPWHPIPGIADALHAAHVVSVLAASGHTIMQVPELDELDCVSATPGSGKVRCYLDDARMTADDARDLAGLLLAAAAAAEEEEA